MSIVELATRKASWKTEGILEIPYQKIALSVDESSSNLDIKSVMQELREFRQHSDDFPQVMTTSSTLTTAFIQQEPKLYNQRRKRLAQRTLNCNIYQSKGCTII
ncbi:hypothetical protein HI914_04850 [Erysiphe necator]|uniref:Uncharacterized protein n=1 Tax=Uncinula necator TaxID=52586 RepID=A0A0B1P338_UNCNE|nr:hypothetical protein HI914_04850 [Erysiphe necator]KHJ31316.1 hypothetical protein EV44_g3380 [Erysiphe necator]